jgi:hypothetical protein
VCSAASSQGCSKPALCDALTGGLSSFLSCGRGWEKVHPWQRSAFLWALMEMGVIWLQGISDHRCSHGAGGCTASPAPRT